MNVPRKKPEVLVAWPESADEMLRALQSYARLRSAYPHTIFELVVFCHTVPPGEVEAVLSSEQSGAAAGDLLARYLDAFD